ncbi:MAG: hypothetical protein ACREBW_01640, partial [Candidatus Micrarchaeaceae archaeon]
MAKYNLVIFDLVGVFLDEGILRDLKSSLADFITKACPKVDDSGTEIWRRVSNGTKTGETTLHDARKAYFAKLGISADALAGYQAIETVWEDNVLACNGAIRDRLFVLKQSGARTVVLTNTSHSCENRMRLLA